MKYYKIIYWLGSITTTRTILAATEEEAIMKLGKNRKDLIKIETIELEKEEKQ
jgi:hypothetical protein